MKDIIDKKKSENGNEKLSMKEMMWYLVAKIDKIDERIDDHIKICNEQFNQKADKKLLYWVAGILFTLFGLVAVYAMR